MPADGASLDFAGWFEAYLGRARDVFDACNNQRRSGHVLMARGRDTAPM